jgi:hypothetical protein
MSFSIYNVSTSFQTFMNHIIAELINNNLITFFNNLLIYDYSREEIV